MSGIAIATKGKIVKMVCSEWTPDEKNQIRSALGIDGVKVAAAVGQLQDMHEQISHIQDMNFNKSILTKIDDDNYNMKVYEDNGIDIRQEFNFIKTGAIETRLPV